MLHKEFWGLVFLSFVVWIFIAASPSSRINHFCKPVGWAGNVVTSLTSLVLPSQDKVIQGWFESLEYGCQYTTWRLFYQEDYNKWVEQSKKDKATEEPSTSLDTNSAIKNSEPSKAEGSK